MGKFFTQSHEFLLKRKYKLKNVIIFGVIVVFVQVCVKPDDLWDGDEKKYFALIDAKTAKSYNLYSVQINSHDQNHNFANIWTVS